MPVKNLKKGDSGKAVLSVQKKLKKLNFYSGTPDGIFDNKTVAAVERFQTVNGLKVDGIAGPQTTAALSGKTKSGKAPAVSKSPKKAAMKALTHEIGRWNGHQFIISPKFIMGFDGLQIKGSSELKDKKESMQGAVSRKGANPLEVSMTVKLNAYSGNDVRKEAIALLNDAKEGMADYFYIGNKKLVDCKLMLTDATIKDVQISLKGTWTSADVQVTMKQCDGGTVNTDASSDDSSSGGGGGSGGSYGGGGSYTGGSTRISVNNTQPAQTPVSTFVQKIGQATKKGLDYLGQKVKEKIAQQGIQTTAAKVVSPLQAINRITTNAKKVTQKKLTGGGGGGRRYTSTR